jgi:hypothetical protein
VASHGEQHPLHGIPFPHDLIIQKTTTPVSH